MGPNAGIVGSKNWAKPYGSLIAFTIIKQIQLMTRNWIKQTTNGRRQISLSIIFFQQNSKYEVIYLSQISLTITFTIFLLLKPLLKIKENYFFQILIFIEIPKPFSKSDLLVLMFNIFFIELLSRQKIQLKLNRFYSNRNYL